LATTITSPLTTMSKTPPHFFSNKNVVYSDRSEELKTNLAKFLKRYQQACSNCPDSHKESFVDCLPARLRSSLFDQGLN
jgi:hypothetical protein